MYNNSITKKEDAINDFTSRFNLDKITDCLDFDNYMAKNFYNGSRTILGNMYGFIEPLEATSVAFFINLFVGSLGIYYLNCKHQIIVIKYETT